MAIDNPEAVKFCNEIIRPMCDLLATAKIRGDAATLAWRSKSLDKVIPATDDIIADGSEEDGRTPITGMDVNYLVGLLSSLGNALNTDIGKTTSNDLIHKIAVNIR